MSPFLSQMNTMDITSTSFVRVKFSNILRPQIALFSDLLSLRSPINFMCTLLGHYAASDANFLQNFGKTHPTHLQGSVIQENDSNV